MSSTVKMKEAQSPNELFLTQTWVITRVPTNLSRLRKLEITPEPALDGERVPINGWVYGSDPGEAYSIEGGVVSSIQSTGHRQMFFVLALPDLGSHVFTGEIMEVDGNQEVSGHVTPPSSNGLSRKKDFVTEDGSWSATAKPGGGEDKKNRRKHAK